MIEVIENLQYKLKNTHTHTHTRTHAHTHTLTRTRTRTHTHAHTHTHTDGHFLKTMHFNSSEQKKNISDSIVILTMQMATTNIGRFSHLLRLFNVYNKI